MYALLAISVMVLAFLSFIYLSGWEQTVQKGETILWEINRDIAVFTHVETPHRNLSYIPVINADQEHTAIIMSVLGNIDERVVAHIGSITVLSSINDVSLICGAQAAGCASPRWGNDRSDFTTDIHIASRDNFAGNVCQSFEHVLYHEIGHVDYYVFHNDQPTDRDVEYYVDNFADKYAKDDPRCAKSLRLFH